MSSVKNPKLEIAFFLLLFAGVGIVSFLVFQPMLNILLLATIFAVLLYPLYEKALKSTGGREGMAAGVVVFLTAVFLITPIFFLTTRLFEEARDFYIRLQGDSTGYLAVVEEAIKEPVERFFPDSSFEVREYAGYAAQFVTDNLGPLVSGAAYVVFGLFLSLIALFSFLRDGRRLAHSLVSLSPLEDDYNKEIVTKIRTTINSVVKGTLLIAIIQGILVALGFLLFGVPDSVLWGTVAALFSLIPGLGTGLVTVPAVLYLIFQAKIISAVLLGIWGVVVVGLSDNFLAPYFYGKGSDIPHIFILFSVFGGIAFFGPLGFLFGPIVLSLFAAVIHIYRLLILKERKEDAAA